MLRLIVPIDDLRGKHIMVKYEGEVTFKAVDRYLKDFFAGKAKVKVDIKSRKAPKKRRKRYSSVQHLTGEEYLNMMKKTKREGKDSVVFFYRSNLKRDMSSLKKLNAMVREMKKLGDLDVEFFAYDVVHNAKMNFRKRVKSLPGINIYLRDYELSRNSTLLKANKHKELMLFLNDRLTSDYSSFFINMNH